MAFDALRLVLQNVWLKVGVGPMVDKMVEFEMTFRFQVSGKNKKIHYFVCYNYTIIATADYI